MTIRITASKAWWVLAAALAAGCHNSDPTQSVNHAGIPGRGGGPEPTSGTSTTPALFYQTPLVAFGTITAFGSVWVNGVRYLTTGATIRIDDRAATESDLHVGDVVRLIGKLAVDGTGIGTEVDVKHALHGPVSAIDAAGTSFVVLGQTVVVDAGVVFDESVPQRSLVGLAAGDVVEVAGLPGRGGQIFASRIAKKPLGPLGLKVTGTATNVDYRRLRFTISGLAVDLRAAPLISLPNETVSNGDRVEVLGSSLSANGELVAREIRPDDPRAYIDATGMRMELEGVIATHDAAQSPASFTLGGIRVTTRPSTLFTGPRANSWLDAKVEVKGVVQPDDSFVASVVRFIHPSPVQLRARVDSVAPAAGTFVALGITVETQRFTRITDESAIHAQPFGLANLTPGDYVHVVGAESPGAILVASLVERIDAQDETQLQGYPQSLSWGQFVILGVTVSTTAATRYPAPNGEDLNEGTFFFDLDYTLLTDVRGVEVADREIVASEARYVDWPW